MPAFALPGVQGKPRPTGVAVLEGVEGADEVDEGVLPGGDVVEVEVVVIAEPVLEVEREVLVIMVDVEDLTVEVVLATVEDELVLDVVGAVGDVLTLEVVKLFEVRGD